MEKEEAPGKHIGQRYPRGEAPEDAPGDRIHEAPEKPETGYRVTAEVEMRISVQILMSDKNTLEDVVRHGAETAVSEITAALADRLHGGGATPLRDWSRMTDPALRKIEVLP